MICHNLAGLYAESPEHLSQAIELLERALQSDPRYARAHISLAACLRDRGDIDSARHHAQWVVENDRQLRDEAVEFLKELDSAH